MMRSVVGAVPEIAAGRPWLIVGKGPSAEGIASRDLSKYAVLTLNHACLVVQADIAHFVDLEAYLDCRSRRELSNVSLPWHPHVEFRIAGKNLLQLGFVDALKQDLLSYNQSGLSPAKRHKDLPVVRLRHFSAVAAFSILALAGVKKISTIGVDGGTNYSSEFRGLKPLTNGRSSFDSQFGEIARIVQKWKIEVRKL